MTAPAAGAELRSRDPELALLVERADRLGTEAFLAEAIGDRFAGRIAVVSSFGVEAAALLHLVAGIDRRVPVVFIDSGKLFPETLAYRDDLVLRLGLADVRSMVPNPASLRRDDPDSDLWGRDPDACCHVRKVEPLAGALIGFAAWISGRKRFHGGDRSEIPLVERSEGRFKLNPLAAWSAAEIRDYFARHRLPPHPLVARGYGSVGCTHCTSPTRPGEDARAGRWRGNAKTECGIHIELGLPVRRTTQKRHGADGNG